MFYVYQEPASNSCNSPVWTILTEKSILAQYWTYWSTRMIEKGLFCPERMSQMEERCIDDFLTVHWAFPASAKEIGDMFADEELASVKLQIE